MVVGKAPIQIREDCCGSGSGKIMLILPIRIRILSAQGLPQIKGWVEEGKVAVPNADISKGTDQGSALLNLHAGARRRQRDPRRGRGSWRDRPDPAV
jgi:hypothetical protein